MNSGGCLCGAVRYRIGSVRDAGLCHCASCRRGSGSAFGAWAEAEVTLERGTPRDFKGRAFCGECGTPLWQDERGARHVQIGTLDDPAAVEPRIHLAAHEQMPWLRLGDRWEWTEQAVRPKYVEHLPFQLPLDPEVTRESPLSLRPITPETLGAVLVLDVAGHQRRMVSSNAISLAQLPHAPRAWAHAICAGETAVGFAQVEILPQDVAGLPTRGEPFVWRFMIDERYQGHGFGRGALELIADAARGQADGTASALWLSCTPGHGSPYEFYRRLGFEDTGVSEEDEVFLKRDYAPTAHA